MSEELDLRLFARLRAAILECPWCGELADLRTSASGRARTIGPPTKIYAGSFDPLTARWKCRGCKVSGVLGVVLYLTDEKDEGVMPADWRATLQQAAKLRELAGGRVSRESWRKRAARGKGSNQIRRGGDHG